MNAEQLRVLICHVQQSTLVYGHEDDGDFCESAVKYLFSLNLLDEDRCKVLIEKIKCLSEES